jgi:RNA polymerase sigma-70 factor (ECF subfamily)
MGVRASDAEDLVQEVLLVVARHLKEFEHSGRSGAFRSWLRVILANRVKDYWRSRKHRAIAPGGTDWGTRIMMLADEDSDASREWNREHDRKVIELLLDEIRPRFAAMTWEAFSRQVFGGQRADQVAAALGMPISSVYVARSRILSALRIEAKGLVDE